MDKFLISGGVWRPVDIEGEPQTTLSEWRVFEVKMPFEETRTRHFVGWAWPSQEGRVSSKIVQFDVITRRGITQSGRIYELVGCSGNNPDGDYTWRRWMNLNEATDVVDVTSEISLLPGQKS